MSFRTKMYIDTKRTREKTQLQLPTNNKPPMEIKDRPSKSSGQNVLDKVNQRDGISFGQFISFLIF